MSFSILKFAHHDVSTCYTCSFLSICASKGKVWKSITCNLSVKKNNAGGKKPQYKLDSFAFMNVQLSNSNNNQLLWYREDWDLFIVITQDGSACAFIRYVSCIYDYQLVGFNVLVCSALTYHCIELNYYYMVISFCDDCVSVAVYTVVLL